MASSLRLKRKQQQQHGQPPYGQEGFASSSGSCRAPGGGGVFGLLLSPAEPPAAPRDGRKRRLYFRCSYREDRHCMASKLVQQVTHDLSPLYEVSYMYEHTCNAAPVPAPDVEADAGAEPPADVAGGGGGLFLSFGSSSGGGNGKHHGGGAGTMQQQYDHHQPVLPQSPFGVMNYDCPNSCKLAAQMGSSPSFPITGQSEQTPPSTTDEDEYFDDMLSTLDWNSFLYDLDDILHFSAQSCGIST